MAKSTKRVDREEAIQALVREPTVERAAASLAVAPSVIHQMFMKGDFMDEYFVARKLAFQQARGLAVRYAPAAVTSLARIMADDSAPKAARVAASGAILRFAADVELEPTDANNS